MLLGGKIWVSSINPFVNHHVSLFVISDMNPPGYILIFAKADWIDNDFCVLMCSVFLYLMPFKSAHDLNLKYPLCSKFVTPSHMSRVSCSTSTRVFSYLRNILHFARSFYPMIQNLMVDPWNSSALSASEYGHLNIQILESWIVLILNFSKDFRIDSS
jgi:hypothetical protein